MPRSVTLSVAGRLLSETTPRTRPDPWPQVFRSARDPPGEPPAKRRHDAPRLG
jgi:hypothetical protein